MARRVADELVAVWQRQSIAIGDRPAFEDCDVIWLQTPTRYADIRVALPGSSIPPSSFAGAVDWQEPVLTFHHELDLTREFPVDAGTLEGFAGSDMIESGTFELAGKSVPFCERWRRQTSQGASFEAHEARGASGLSALVVQVDDHRLAIVDQRPVGGEYSASYGRRVDGTWRIELSIGSPLPLAEIERELKLLRVD